MELNASPLASARFSHEQVKLLLEKDEEFFIQFFMGDELTLPVPDFHVEIFHRMTDLSIPRLAIAIPRDHAKTTLAKLTCTWYFLFSEYSFIVYLSNTATVAQNACRDVMAFFQSENFKQLYGDVNLKINREGEGFYEFELDLGNGEIKYCILKALGAGQQVRGLNIKNRRPQLAVVDDLEDPELIDDEKQYKKLKKWFMGTFRKALDKMGHKIIQIGNLVSRKCILGDNCSSQYWASIVKGCLLPNLQPLWPEAWPIDKLRADFKEYCEQGEMDTWFAEMMNLVIASGMGLIKARDIQYEPALNFNDIEYGFITVDPAISKEKWAHECAVVAHGFADGRWQILEYESEVGVDPLKLFAVITRIALSWGITVIGVEATAYQESLQYVFPYMAKQEGYVGLQFLPIHVHNTRKVQRLAGWATMLKSGSYVLNHGEFKIVQQLLTFIPGKKDNDDNIIDACVLVKVGDK